MFGNDDGNTPRVCWCHRSCQVGIHIPLLNVKNESGAHSCRLSRGKHETQPTLARVLEPTISLTMWPPSVLWIPTNSSFTGALLYQINFNPSSSGRYSEAQTGGCAGVLTQGKRRGIRNISWADLERSLCQHVSSWVLPSLPPSHLLGAPSLFLTCFASFNTHTESYQRSLCYSYGENLETEVIL